MVDAVEAHAAGDGAHAEDEGDTKGEGGPPFDEFAAAQVAGEHAGAPGDVGDADDPAFFAVSCGELEEARHGGGQGPGGGGGHGAEDVEPGEGVGHKGEPQGAEGDAGSGDEDGTPPADAVAEAAGEDLEGACDGEADRGVGRCRRVGAGDAGDEERNEEGDGAPVAGGKVADAKEEANFPAAEETQVAGEGAGCGAGAFAAAREFREEDEGAGDETDGGDTGDRTKRLIAQGVCDGACKEAARRGAQGAAQEVAGRGEANHGGGDGAQEVALSAGAAEAEGGAQADTERNQDEGVAGEEDEARKQRADNAQDEYALDAEHVAEHARGDGEESTEDEEERFQKAGKEGRSEVRFVHIDRQERVEGSGDETGEKGDDEQGDESAGEETGA